MSTQLAAQMYTLRDHCEDSAGIADSCKKLKAMGYDAIQASAGFFGEIAAKELKQILDDTGMQCCATHRGWEQLKNVQAEIDFHSTIGCQLAAIGGWGWNGDETKDDWKQFATEFQALAEPYTAAGIRIGYHNHSHEWAPFGLANYPNKIDPTQTPMHLLVEELSDPTFFEIDTYWVAHGGGDPAHWLRQLKGRIPGIHLKDMTVTPNREHKMCEVGAGNLNWPAILDAAKEAGVQWYIVERDAGDLDPFESLRLSLENCKAWGLA
ncbi:MAG: sugar phosphate isomerase/epimerase [Planctomycetota bacterium]